jgi:thiamine-phosphate pyrophosphorylase
MAPNLASLLRLMLVTDDALLAGRDLVSLAQAAERGGVTSVELRLKRATGRELVAAARALVTALRVPVVVNDRPDIALAAGAAGVHLGPDDLPVEHARRLAPPGFIVGASAGSSEEAMAGRDADYWGVGPWRTTGTKPDAGVPLGVEGFRRLVALGQGKPCLAIGGVRAEDVEAVLAAGGAGVGVASGILAAGDVEEAAREYSTAVRSKK